MTVRGAFVRLHRWAGLAMAVFLVIAGLTGSVIAFNHELDEWLNPELFRVAARGPHLSPLDVAARIEASERRRYVSYVPLHVEPGHALVLGLRARVDPATAAGQAADTRYDELFVDPVTGTRLGERTWGACCLSRRQLIPFVYSIHYSLHLPDVWGLRVMGAVALVWMVDCFVGFYLTLPAGRPFWARWKHAWRIKRGAHRVRLNFDLHRALGLWIWLVFLMLAVSGVYLALRYEVFRPVLSLVMPITPDPFEQAAATAAPTGSVSPPSNRVSYHTIVAAATEEARRRGWAPPFDVFHSPEFGVYGVGFGDHHAAGMGVPYLYFDAITGRVRSEVVPGRGTTGDVFMQWLFPLHSGQALGLGGRIAISLSGLAVVVLTITGVVIWAKKRQGRRRSRSLSPAGVH